MTDRKAKQVIVIRRDLGMRRGKEIAQGAHASQAWLVSRLQQRTRGISAEFGGGAVYVVDLNEAEKAWTEGHFTKIVCQVPGQAELVAIYEAAKEAGLGAYLITDAGFTEFKEPTMTAVGIGPDWADEVDKVTGELKLY